MSRPLSHLSIQLLTIDFKNFILIFLFAIALWFTTSSPRIISWWRWLLSRLQLDESVANWAIC